MKHFFVFLGDFLIIKYMNSVLLCKFINFFQKFINLRSKYFMVQQLLGLVSFLSKVSWKTLCELKLHGDSISFAHFPENDMSFFNPCGSFLNFDFFEVLLFWQDPVNLFSCGEVCNTERLDSAPQYILSFEDEYVFRG